MAYIDQAVLAADPDFISRVRMAMLDAATDIYSEAPATEHHRLRGDLAVNVVRDPRNWQSSFVELICADSSTLTTESDDVDIKSAVASVWNILAGVVTV